MPDTTYTFDELDPFALAWHRDGYIWSPGPGGGQPVYRWPIETDAAGNAAEPDLDDPRVNVMRAEKFPWSGWRHLADCGCEDCTDEPLLCPACAADRARDAHADRLAARIFAADAERHTADDEGGQP